MSISKKRIISTLAIALVVVIATSALAFLSSGFKDWNLKNWFNKGPLNDVVAVDDDGNELVSGKVYSLANQMTFLSETYEDIILRATILPLNADNQLVNWDIEWTNSASSWAIGKTVTDYVTVTPTSSGALTAKVSCNAAFAERIMITVTSQDNSAAMATCLVDFMKRLEGMTVYATAPSDMPNLNSSGTGGYTIMRQGAFKINYMEPILSIGTISEEYNMEFAMIGNEQMHNRIASQLGLGAFPTSPIVMNEYDCGFNTMTLPIAFYGATSPMYLISEVFRANTDIPWVFIDCTLSGQYSDYTFRLSIYGSDAAFPISVDAIILDYFEIIL